MKKPWDGFCQPGNAQGSHRLRLVAGLRRMCSQDHDIHHGWLCERSCDAWHHYDDLYRDERALEERGRAKKPTWTKPDPAGADAAMWTD